MIFIGYVSIRVYSYNDHSDFIYNVTRVVRLPAAWLGSPRVTISYEDYLFELRRQIHYFSTQQDVDFSSPDGKLLLASYQRKSLQTVIDNTYISQLAKQHAVFVSEEEIDTELSLLRQQNRLAGTDEELEVILKDFWGWSLSDYRRSIRRELVRQKVTATFNHETYERARMVLERIDAGEDFADLATEFSDDISTAANGGEYDFWLDLSAQNAHPKVLEATFVIDVDQTTEIVNTGYQLEIIKVLEVDGDLRRIAHVSFSFADIGPQIDEQRQASPPRILIDLP